MKVYIVLILVFLLATKISLVQSQKQNQQQKQPSHYEITKSENEGTAHEIHDLVYSGDQDIWGHTKGNKIVKQPQVHIRTEDVDVLSVQIIDSQKNRYEMPDLPVFEETFLDVDEPTTSAEDSLFVFEKSNNPFTFNVIRKDTNEKLIQVNQSIVYSENYLEIQIITPTNLLIGLGQRNPQNLRMKEGLYSLYGRDQPVLIEDGTGFKGVYSSHPMYLMREQSGKYHVVFFKSSVAMDVNIEMTNDNRIQATFKVLGGIFHIKVFLGDLNPETAIQRYHKYLGGGYVLQPFWSMGFHQCRWGYQSGQRLIEVVKNHRTNDLPLDTIWSDIDFMINKQTFSVDERRFPPNAYDQLYNELDVSYVPIVDVAVGVRYSTDQALILGQREDIFCRSPDTGKLFKGDVWPGSAYFPDFFNPKTENFWGVMMESLHKKTNYTGMWLDMNEPANFCNGECNWFDMNQEDEVNHEYQNARFDLPYRLGYSDLNIKTLPYHLLHYGSLLHKDVHNLYGFLDGYYTFKALSARLEQGLPFILSRSTFPGQGKYTQHWTGDNGSTYPFLRISIPALVQFNIFGIPFSGSDVCGFMGTTNEELCIRWIQLGATYPFMRNHNNDQARDQEFYVLGNLVKNVARKNLYLRYSLLKHYYSLFVRNKGTGTVMRPVFFEFSDDDICRQDSVLDSQFLLGSELMVTPVLQEGQNFISPYFPRAGWNDLLTGFKKQDENETPARRLVTNFLNDTVPIFIRSGKIVLWQDLKFVKNTRGLNNEFQLVVSLGRGRGKFEAEGTIFYLEDYHNEVYIRDECMFKDKCLVDINVEINLGQSELILTINRRQQEFRQHLLITKIKVYNYNQNNIAPLVKENFKISSGHYSYVWIFTPNDPIDLGTSENVFQFNFQ